MTLVRRRGSVLDVWTFGDTTPIVRQPDGSVRCWATLRTCAISRLPRRRELLQQAGAKPTAILDEPVFRAWLAERRERQRQKRYRRLPS